MNETDALQAFINEIAAKLAGYDAALAATLARLAAVEAAIKSLSAPEPSPVLSTARRFTLAEFVIQSKAPERVSLVQTDRGQTIRLHTEPGDTGVAGSGSSERCDLMLSQSETEGFEGREQWWAHSILFPDDYVVPISVSPWSWSTVFTFHHTGLSGQSNLNLHVLPNRGLVLAVASGPTVVNSPSDPGFRDAGVGPLVKNMWYDFVYHVKWSATSGFFDAWVDGVRKMSYSGPTLYVGMGCYLKLQNYHSAFGLPASVIHGFPVRAEHVEDLGWRLALPNLVKLP